jgi:hypothetical protein
MRELSSKRLIVAKGLMFLVLAGMAATLLLLEAPSLRVALLLAILAWASCRFYYFLFYVLQHYVDPELRYAGLIALLGTLFRK